MIQLPWLFPDVCWMTGKLKFGSVGDSGYIKAFFIFQAILSPLGWPSNQLAFVTSICDCL
jgi:hypothetical protein